MTSSRRATWSGEFRTLCLPLLIVGTSVSAMGADTDDSGGNWRERWGVSGSVRTGLQGRDRRYSPERGFVPGSAWLSLKPEEFAGTRFTFEGYLQTDDVTRGAERRGEVREAYLDRAFGALDLRVGRQIQVWGRGDKVNPTDQLTTRDLTRLFADDEEQRLGVFAAQATWNLADYRLTGVWQPEWRMPVYPIPPLTGIRLVDRGPEHPAAQAAFKLDRTGGSVDWSASFFNGYSRTPDLQVLSAGPSGVDIALAYRRVQVYGADVAFTTGEYGWRGEAAYTRTLDRGGVDPGAQNSNLFLVAGVERTLLTGFNLNAQGLYRRTFDFRDPASFADSNLRLLAEQQALVSNQLSADLFGLTLRPSYLLWNDTLQLETAAVIWFGERGSTLLRPKVSYAVNDRVKLTVGAESYLGGEASFFGRLQPLSTVFGELRWGF